MARETIYLVQAFKAGKGARVNAETSIRCKPSDTACREAEYLATTKAGVVTFAKSGDAELGEYDDGPRSSARQVACRHRSRRHEGEA